MCEAWREARPGGARGSSIRGGGGPVVRDGAEDLGAGLVVLRAGVAAQRSGSALNDDLAGMC